MTRFTAHPESSVINASIARMWLAGDTSVDIGRALGLTKNAVMGRVRDMRAKGINLPGRTNPCVRQASVAPRSVSAQPVARPRPASVPAPVLPKPAAPPVGVRCGCRFPLWAHGERPTHRYCSEPVAAPRRSWCVAHYVVVFGRPWVVQEVAA